MLRKALLNNSMKVALIRKLLNVSWSKIEKSFLPCELYTSTLQKNLTSSQKNSVKNSIYCQSPWKLILNQSEWVSRLSLNPPVLQFPFKISSKNFILEVLMKAEGNKHQAAKKIVITRSTSYGKLRKQEIVVSFNGWFDMHKNNTYESRIRL